METFARGEEAVASMRSTDGGRSWALGGTVPLMPDTVEAQYSDPHCVELPDGTLLAFWEHGDGNNVTVRSSSQSGILDGAWHHVAAVRERATQTVRFTVDGEPLGEPVEFDTEPTGGSRGMVYLGSDTRAYAGDSDLAGALDEVCIFDLVLDDVQLAALAGAADCSAVLGEDGDGGDGDGGADTGSAPDTQGGDDATDDAGGESGSVEPAAKSGRPLGEL